MIDWLTHYWHIPFAIMAGAVLLAWEFKRRPGAEPAAKRLLHIVLPILDPAYRDRYRISFGFMLFVLLFIAAWILVAIFGPA